MEECTVIRTGETSDGRHWSLVQREVEGFILTGIVNPVKAHKVDDKVKIPKTISDKIKWEA